MPNIYVNGKALTASGETISYEHLCSMTYMPKDAFVTWSNITQSGVLHAGESIPLVEYTLFHVSYNPISVFSGTVATTGVIEGRLEIAIAPAGGGESAAHEIFAGTRILRNWFPASMYELRAGDNITIYGDPVSEVYATGQ